MGYALESYWQAFRLGRNALCRSPPQPLFIPRQSPVSAILVHHNRFRIPRLLRRLRRSSPIRVMYGFPLHHLQLRHPLPDILALRIILLALQQRIENPKIRLGIHSRARAESPSPVIAREVAIDEVFHKVALAHAPVEQEIFGQEGGDGHAGAVVHVAGVVELAHGGVDEGVPCSALGPGMEQFL